MVPATIHNDARFFTALNRVAEVCGDDIRLRILARTVKITRGATGRLAKLKPAKMRQIVEEAVATGKRPRLRPLGGQKTIVVRLPLGRPTAQLEVLLARLGPKEFAKMQRAWSQGHCRGKGLSLANRDFSRPMPRMNLARQSRNHNLKTLLLVRRVRT